MGDAADPLELEHMMGFDGESRRSVQFHPVDTTKMISYTGCLLVISDVNDPHEQEFLRGHNEAISCLAISSSGAMIASGQTSTTRVPNSEAMVIVWDYRTRLPVYRLMELHDGIQFSRNSVQQLAFSPDDRFLAGSDDQPGGAKFCVWHTDTGQLATMSKVGQRELAFLTWGEMVASTRKIQKTPSYRLLAAVREKVILYMLEYEVHTMQYKLTQETLQLPSSGLERTYHCATVIHRAEDRSWMLVAGSSAGELCVFSLSANDQQTKIFRACVPVSQGGVLSIAVRDAGDIFGDSTAPLAYCGCGDGCLKVLQGFDLQWTCINETRLSGRILSLTLSADGRELLAGTSNGNIYRLDAASLRNLSADGTASDRPLLASHCKPISALAFAPESSEWFITASTSGHLRRWELSQYGVEYQIDPPVKTTDAYNVTHAESLVLSSLREADGAAVYAGWSDGAIRCYTQESGQLLWEIVNAHRKGVSCLAISPLYYVSAGIDGAVRVWSDGESHSLLGNFDEHKERVTGVCVDLHRPNIIHSASSDKTLVTIDLNQARRVACHTVKDGKFSSMTQATTGELELITADTAGSLKWWDTDYAEPVSQLVTWSPHHDPNKDRRITSIDLSPPMTDGSPGSDFLIATTSTGDLQVWDLLNRSSAPISIGAAHSDEITTAKWAPDGKQIVSVGKDASICVWNFYGQ